MEESRYKELLKESISNQWSRFEYFRNLCKKKGRSLKDLLLAIDDGEYFRIPAVMATAFKKSKGLVRELNDLSREGSFQVSSSTSGDPSYIFTSRQEMDKILDNYRLTFGIEGVSRAIGFAPSCTILDGLSKKSGYMGQHGVARMKLALDAGKMHYKELTFTLDVDIFRTIIAKITGGNAVLKKKHLDEIISIISVAEKENERISLGGVVLLFNPYLNQLKDGQFNLGSKAFFPFSGGGYNGSKGAIRGEKISKPEMVKKISAVFGIENRHLSTNIKDIYAFTESSATHEGFWSESLNDYLFRTWHESKVYIVDPETEEPVKSGTGLIKVITPYADGNPSAANVSVLQLDSATIRECQPDYSVTLFSNIKRVAGASVEGCAYKAEEIARA